MAPVYKIHPAIGIARVGDSDAFFIGPENRDDPGVEIGAGGEAPLGQYKFGGKIKRQAARFRVFEYERADDGTLRLVGEVVGAGTVIEWSVSLVNSKAAGNALAPVVAGARRVLVPGSTPRNAGIADRASLTINGGTHTVSGFDAAPRQFDMGSFLGTAVNLGDVRTDAQGRLIVLGGRGMSRGIPLAAGGAIPRLNHFANNDRWHDDVSDGPVTARVLIPGKPAAAAMPAWVICAPPDYAPAAGSPSTIYDLVTQAAIDRGWISAPAMPSFTSDVLPILQRALSLRWVEDWTHWNAVTDDWAALSRLDNNAGRNAAYRQILETSLNEYQLPKFIGDILIAWRDGNFVDDFGEGALQMPLPKSLDCAALDACVGTSFYPGIEAGYLLANPNIYAEPGRLSHQQVRAGELTGQMAVPWQADFMDCADDWWPSQRPTDVFTSAANVPYQGVRWDDGITGGTGPTMRAKMVTHFAKLGFVVPDGAGNLIEVERDPSLPPR